MMSKVDLDSLYIQTFTGKKFYYFNPNTEAVDILDIATALSRTCRFSGMSREFYSVAEHSYHCSYLVPPELALEALLHDASEAYTGDLPKPLKRGIAKVIEPLEDEILSMIFDKWDLEFPFPPEIKKVDMQMLYWERHAIMGSPDNQWEDLKGLNPDIRNKPDIKCWGPNTAKKKFLQRFKELTS